MDKPVLCVEDNELNMKLIRDLLAVDGIPVLEASDAETALEILRDHKPALILMDIQLPGMDGYSATRLIKQDPVLRDVPVIVLTAFAMDGDETRAYQSGAEAYIAKPIDARRFREVVKRFLSIHPAEEPATAVPAPSFRPKILIVDDNPLNIKLLEAMLAPNRFRIARASCGQEALTRIGEDMPDLILLDVMMPDLDGFEVTRRIKQDPLTVDVPVILVTALDGSENRAAGLEAGAEEFITKPVNPHELQARVNSMLRLKQFRDALATRNESERTFDSPERSNETPRLSEAPDHPTVLLVEDDPAAAEVLSSFLKDEPYHLEIVGSGADALALAESAPLDAVILDILLPDISGFDICRRIKASEKNKDVPIIMVTCLTDLESRITAIEMGSDDFLVKPVLRRELVARVRVLIEKKRQIEALRSRYITTLNSAILDWLTGAFNRGYADRHLALEIKRAVRHAYSVALIMIDIDDFKDCNDRLGHEAGDKILKEAAAIFKTMVREIDLVARYGGDEFLIILPYADGQGASQVAQRILGAVHERQVQLTNDEPRAKLSLSMGIAVCPAEGTDSAALTRQADRMLYQAKLQGKGRFSIGQQTPSGPPQGVNEVHDIAPSPGVK